VKLLLVAVGKVRTPYLKEGCADYLRRIRKLAPVEVKEVKAAKGTKPDAAKQSEAAAILAALKSTVYKTVALSDRGKNMTSVEFTKMIEDIEKSGRIGMTFVIGGAWGLAEEVIDKADAHLSLGPMTMSHELARLVLVEQIYRAMATLRGVPYAK